jgi:hypothetical protein
MSRKEAIVDVAKLAGVPKREVYQAVHVSERSEHTFGGSDG